MCGNLTLKIRSSPTCAVRARRAGSSFTGRLMVRPGQDCSVEYGRRIVLSAITTLSAGRVRGGHDRFDRTHRDGQGPADPHLHVRWIDRSPRWLSTRPSKAALAESWSMSEPATRRSSRYGARRLILVAAAALLVGALAFALARGPWGSSDVPEPTSLPSVLRPSPHVEASYDAVFDGDATGATDVTAELTAFLRVPRRTARGSSRRRDLLRHIRDLHARATSRSTSAARRSRGSNAACMGSSRSRSASNLVINDAHIVGTGYEWVGGEGESRPVGARDRDRQWVEHHPQQPDNP